jgi:putative DNA primase/helicase
MNDHALIGKAKNLSFDRWDDLLPKFGINAEILVNKHRPCPLQCNAGKSLRSFRYDNLGGHGTWICSHCGAGGGWKLLRLLTGSDDAQLAREILSKLGESTDTDGYVPPPRLQIAPGRRSFEIPPEEIAKRKAKYKACWDEAEPIQPGDPAYLYLKRRVPPLAKIPDQLRLHPKVRYSVQHPKSKEWLHFGDYPAMVAAVQGPDGYCCNIHRTFLSPEGKKLDLTELALKNGMAEADVPVRKLMPSIQVDGWAIRLGGSPGRKMGIAEGIETALSASLLERYPCWSVVSTSGMAGFALPVGVEELVIFADNDKLTADNKRPGFDAAKRLMERSDIAELIAQRKLKVNVRTPARTGQDMNDLILSMLANGASF